MMEDLLAIDINAEQVVMRTEPSIADCDVEVGGNHMLSTDSEDCALEINVAVCNSDEEDDEELAPANWEGLDNIIFNFWGPLHSPRSMIQKTWRSITYSVALSAIALLAIRTYHHYNMIHVLNK
jgi:hypothetical protein